MGSSYSKDLVTRAATWETFSPIASSEIDKSAYRPPRFTIIFAFNLYPPKQTDTFLHCPYIKKLGQCRTVMPLASALIPNSDPFSCNARSIGQVPSTRHKPGANEQRSLQESTPTQSQHDNNVIRSPDSFSLPHLVNPHRYQPKHSLHSLQNQ